MESRNKNGKKAYAQSLMASIITVILFVLVSILMSTVISFVYKIDDLFYASTIGSSVAILLTYAIWAPVGVEKGIKNENYINASKLYFKRANYIVDKQLFKECREFCAYKNSENRKNIIMDLLGKENVEYRLYELSVKPLKTEEEQNELKELSKELSKSQRKLLNKVIHKRITFEKLAPKHLTTGRSREHEVVNHNKEKPYVIIRMLVKILWGVGTTCFSYFVVIAPADGFGYPQIEMIGIWLFTFLMAVYSAIRNGYNSIVKERTNFYIDQSDLCSEFFAYTHILLADVDNNTDTDVDKAK